MLEKRDLEFALEIRVSLKFHSLLSRRHLNIPKGGGFYMYQKGLWILKGIVSNTKPNTDSSVVNPTCSDGNYALFTDVALYLGECGMKLR